jgi:hypothetical protein
MDALAESIRGKTIEKFLIAINDDIFDKIKQHVHATSFEPTISPDTTMGNYTVKEYYSFWMGLSSLMIGYLFACNIKYGNNLKTLRLARVVIVEKNDLAKNISSRQGIDFDSCTQIVSDMCLDTSRNRADLQLDPLIPIGENRVAISPHLIFSANWEVCLLRKWAIESPSKYGAELRIKKGKLEQELEDILKKEKVLVGRERIIHDIETGKQLTDVDLAVFDHRDNNLLVIQIKWVIDYDSYQEQSHCEEELQKGIRQIRTCQNEVKRNLNHFLQEIFPENDLQKENIEKIYFYLICRGSVGTGIEDEEGDIIVLDYDLCVEYLRKTNIGTINQRLLSLAKYQESIEKEIIKDIELIPMNIAGYVMRTEGRRSTLFKIKRKTALTNIKEPCICGSGKPYKYCCYGLVN